MIYANISKNFLGEFHLLYKIYCTKELSTKLSRRLFGVDSAYIKRELSDDAIWEFDTLMLSSPEFRKKVKQVKAIYDLSERLRKQKRIDSSKAWDKLSRRITFNSFRVKVWNITRTAAAVLLPLFLLHQFVIQPMLKTTPSEMITLS